MADQIIDCDGIYEVHPVNDGCWAVVNGQSGQVHSEYGSQAEAVEVASALNECDDE